MKQPLSDQNIVALLMAGQIVASAYLLRQGAMSQIAGVWILAVVVLTPVGYALARGIQLQRVFSWIVPVATGSFVYSFLAVFALYGVTGVEVNSESAGAFETTVVVAGSLLAVVPLCITFVGLLWYFKRHGDEHERWLENTTLVFVIGGSILQPLANLPVEVLYALSFAFGVIGFAVRDVEPLSDRVAEWSTVYVADNGEDQKRPVYERESRESTATDARPTLLLGVLLAATFLMLQLVTLLLVSDPTVGENITEQMADTPYAGEDGVVTNTTVLVGVLLGLGLVTTGYLVAFEYSRGRVIRILFAVLAWQLPVGLATMVSDAMIVAAAAHVIGVGLAALYWKYSRWYVLNAIALIFALFGLVVWGPALPPQFLLLFMGSLLLYDAIAVYGSGHMQSLAAGGIKNKLPIMLVFPVSWPYRLPETVEDAAEQQGMLLGLGDIIVPSLLVISAAVHSPASPIEIGALVVTAPAIGAAAGILFGVAVLLRLPGSVHAGLPPLNLGAAAGYALACLLVGAPLLPIG